LGLAAAPFPPSFLPLHHYFEFRQSAPPSLLLLLLLLLIFNGVSVTMAAAAD
jgi:hypothetical protein